MKSHLPLFAGLLLGCATNDLAAQDAPLAPAGPRSAPAIANRLGVLDGRVALGIHDGVLRAAGGAYKAEFAAGGVTVIPACGAAAPRNYPAVWRTTGIGRGEDLAVAAAAAPRLTGDRVEYARGACVERYEPRGDGLEQSFVFATLPAGAGDLVVRGALATELQVEAHDGGGLRLAAPGIGSYVVTGVVGVAADGARCAGRMRLVGGVLEYALPAAFVAQAALPLVLDPTWGTQITVENSTAADRHPDVACNQIASRRWLVAWEHVFSAVDFDVYGQYLDDQDQLSGPKMFLAATGAHERSVSLCDNGFDSYVMVYASGTGVLARTLDAGVLGAAVTVATTGSSPDIGSHLASTSHRVAIVWDNGLGIDCAVYTVGAGTLSLFNGPSALFTGTASAPFNFPSISHSSGIGADGHAPAATEEQRCRWAIVAQRDYSTDSDLHLRVVDFNGYLVGSYAIDTTFDDHDYAEVDGNGHDWIVAWQRRVGSERDVVAQQFTLPLGSTTVSAPAASPTVIAGALGLIEVYPSVRCIGASCMIGYVAEVTAGQFQPRMTSRSLIGCEVCAGDVPLPGSLTTTIASGRIAIASRELESPTDHDAMLAYEYPNPAHAGNGQILAFRADFLDGRLVDVTGSGCGPVAGTLLTNCATMGPPALRVHLRDSLPATNVWLVLSPYAVTLNCGGCVLMPDPFRGISVAATTDAVGGAVVSLPPVTTGALWNWAILAQWLILNPTSPGCATYGVDMSSAKAISVQ